MPQHARHFVVWACNRWLRQRLNNCLAASLCQIRRLSLQILDRASHIQYWYSNCARQCAELATLSAGGESGKLRALPRRQLTNCIQVQYRYAEPSFLVVRGSLPNLHNVVSPVLHNYRLPKCSNHSGAAEPNNNKVDLSRRYGRPDDDVRGWSADDPRTIRVTTWSSSGTRHRSDPRFIVTEATHDSSW